ncbi:hypothetical protein DFH06DRAFT_1336071 [Mycena polygramma]|nr:hypothetical protein DFH06DRAFT_1336071 [Mycena polygramma]
MAHIQYFRLTHPDAEKDHKKNSPTTEEIRANARTQNQLCSGCGEPSSSSEQLKNCAGCRVARYCSKKCQVSDWPAHKKLCGGSESPTDINLKLARKLIANDRLMFYLKVYTVLALELLTAPENALETCLVVKITTKDADPLAAMRAMMNQEERSSGFSVMLQIADIEKKPLATQTTPGMRMSLEKVKTSLIGSAYESSRVAMIIFTGDGTNFIGVPTVIGPEALKQGRELNPFVIKSALTGTHKVPVTEKSIIEQFNNNIYMDKENQYLLHTVGVLPV